MRAAFLQFKSPATGIRLGFALTTLLLFIDPRFTFAQPAPTQISPPRKIRVGVLIDNYPFSFRDADGKIKGFAYELVEEIERVMGLQFERVEGTTKAINSAFEAGQIDMLQSLARSPARSDVAEFSVPYLNMAGQIFIRRGGSPPRSLADLKGRKVLVHHGSLGEQLLLSAGLKDSIAYVDSVEQALIQLDRGAGDATLATRLTGLSVAHRLGLTQVLVLDLEIPNFAVDYCIAVQKGDHLTLARINEGIALLVRTGQFDALYKKWFGFVTPTGYSAEQILQAVAAGLSLALGIAVWAFLRQRALLAHIAAQALVLQRSEESLANAQARARLGSWELDLATGRGTWSAEMGRLLHHDLKQGVPTITEFLELVHPDDRENVRQIQARFSSATAPIHHEYRTNPDRGPVRFLNSTLHVIRDSRGQPATLAGTTLDVTAQKTAAAAQQFANRRLQLIAQMTDTIFGTKTTTEVAQHLATLTKECFEVDACVIRILEGDQLALLGAEGVPAGELPQHLPIFGLAKQVVNSGKPLVISDVSTYQAADGLSRPPPGTFSFTSYAGVPLIAEGRTVGLLGIYTAHTAREYSDLDIEHLQIVANHAAVSLSNERLFEIVRSQKTELETTISERERAEAQLRVFSQQLRALSARLETLREAERVRISREIHDVLGQKLTALKMDLYWLEKRLPQVGDLALRSALEDKLVVATELANDIVLSVQKIAAELRPATLDNLGLISTLQHEAKQFESRTGISVRLQLPDQPLKLPNQIATTAYRIFQEVLTNIIRHAHATQVQITLTVSTTQLRLLVADNGVGVSPEDLVAPKSLGLLGMTERAAMVNGKVRIQGAPERGTTVELEIPVEISPALSEESNQHQSG